MLTRTSNVLPEVGRAHRRNGGANSLQNFAPENQQSDRPGLPALRGRARELDRLRSSEVCPRSGLPGAKCSGEAAPDPETDLRVRPPVARIPDVAEAKLKMGNPIGLTDPLHRRHPWRAHWRCGAGVPDGCGAGALFPTMKAWTSSRVSMPSLLTSIALKMRS